VTDVDVSNESGDTDHCRECGQGLGAGYLCDDCDTVEGWQ